MQVAIFGGDQDMPSPEAVLAPEVMKTWLDSLNDDGTNLRSLNKKLSPYTVCYRSITPSATC